MIENLTIDELKVILRDHGLQVSGIKSDLVERVKKLGNSDDIVREWKLRRARQEIERLQKEKYEEKEYNTSLRYVIQVRDPKIQEKYEEKKEPKKKELKKENERLKEEMSVLQQKYAVIKKEIDQLKQSKNESDQEIEISRGNINRPKPKKNLLERGNDQMKQKSSGRKNRRYSPQQLSLLEAQLARTPRCPPSKIISSKLATKTGLTKKQVYDWFYSRTNRRVKSLNDDSNYEPGPGGQIF